MTAQRVLFLADAGPTVGGGHVMRCLTLARALEMQGVECAFVESRAAAPILGRFGFMDRTLLAVSQADDLPGLIGVADEFAAMFQPSVVVVDHYGATAEVEARLRLGGRRIAVLDDLADRAHDADLLIDPGYGRRPEDYDGLVPGHTQRLTGPAYALLRPEFASARARAMSRRAKGGPARRALVSLGLTDLGGITGRVAEILAPVLDEIRLDVVVGSGAQSLEALAALSERDRRLRLHVDSTEMYALLADADLAVGAGGSSTWERACVGLPAVTLILADNQRDMAMRLEAVGVTLAVDVREPGFEDALRAAWAKLSDDTEARAAMTHRSAMICDGKGAGRVADAVMALI